MKKIAITTTSFAEYSIDPLELLKGKGLEIALNSLGRRLTKDEIFDICRGTTGIIAGTESLDEEVLNNLSGLKVISRCGSGVDNIDMEAARRLGIKVFNTPDAPVLPVAELTIGLMLNLLRRVNSMDRKVKEGNWKKMMGSLLYGKRVGIIGFGRIGRKVAELLGHFGCLIKYTDPSHKVQISKFQKLALSDLLTWSDIVSIHASSANEIIGRKEIGLMKKGSYLLNLSRGKAVNEEAIFQALKSNYLSAAALDVFEQEPYDGKLKELDNIILTPHIGSYAAEARKNMELDAAKNLIRGLREEK